MKTRHIHALIALIVVLVASQVSTYAGEAQSVSEASDGFDPEKAKLISDTILEIVKDWWFTVFVPMLIPLFFPKFRGMVGQGMQTAGKKMQPKEKDE